MTLLTNLKIVELGTGGMFGSVIVTLKHNMKVFVVHFLIIMT
jgi:hypothetical protein